ncbi:hypothetical protein [Dyella sp. ASV21]|uniref:DUF6984 family protein n=1 Tax=Dyella sp. ASV21 TaxID=2795114 RepID=UPI0018EB942E|nr:hypothetical protein [Dyella sp. ASV21]
MRALNDLEHEAISALANQIGPDDQRGQLLQDLKHCVVDDALSDGSMLKFFIEGYDRPPYRGQDTFRGKDGFPVEGVIKDADGGEMDVLLFSDQNKRVLELELVKHDGSPVLGPDWHSFSLR